MTPVQFTVEVLIYLALLAIARRGQGSPVSDALMWNWLIATAGVMLNGGQLFIPLFIVNDAVTALYLGLSVQTKIARNAAFFFIPMTLLNAVAYAQYGALQGWQRDVLSGLSFAQILVVMWGVWGGGFIEALDSFSRRFGLSLNRVGHNKNKGAR